MGVFSNNSLQNDMICLCKHMHPVTYHPHRAGRQAWPYVLGAVPASHGSFTGLIWGLWKVPECLRIFICHLPPVLRQLRDCKV